MIFFTMNPFKIKVEKVCHSKFVLLQLIGHKTSEPFGVHDNIMIIQRKLLFPTKKNSSKLTLRRFPTP